MCCNCDTLLQDKVLLQLYSYSLILKYYNFLRQKTLIQPSQLVTQNMQLYEEVKDFENEAAGPTGVAVRSKSTLRDLATPLPQYEDVTLPAGAATKSGDLYQITQCAAYEVSNKN